MVDVRDITELLHVNLRNPIFQRTSECVRLLVFIYYWMRNCAAEFGAEIFVSMKILIFPVACELFWAALQPMGVTVEGSKSHRLGEINLIDVLTIHAQRIAHNFGVVHHTQQVIEIIFVSFRLFHDRIHCSFDHLTPIWVINRFFLGQLL